VEAVDRDLRAGTGLDLGHLHAWIGAAPRSERNQDDRKGYFPTGRFQPFVLAGIGTLISEQGSDHIARFAYRFGGGLDVFLTESIYLSASYRYTGNLDDFGYTNMLYLVGYHFD
jgi:opacity protein-like surface antigen